MITAGWLAFEDPQNRFLLRLPANWKVLSDSPDNFVIQEPNRRAELAIAFLDGDCAAAQNSLRARRLNYYLIREYTRSIGGLETTAFEFKDTISNIREFHAFCRVGRRCCHLRSRRSEGSEGLQLESTLETMLSSFEFTTNKS